MVKVSMTVSACSLEFVAGDDSKAGQEERVFGEIAVLRENTQRWVTQNRYRPRLSSGVREMDELLGGGWPLGKVGELWGPLSSGKTSLALATLAQATKLGELALWVDVSGEFDAGSLTAWGIPLEALLVVQASGTNQAVRAVELVLAAGGFTVAVVDLSGQGRGRGAENARLPLRLARAVEQARAVGLVLTERPWLGTWASIQLRLSPARPCFKKEEGAPPWFAGWLVHASVQRGEKVGRGMAWAMGA